MLKKFVAIIALMAIFIISGCNAPVEESNPATTDDNDVNVTETTDTVAADEAIGTELEGEKITDEEGEPADVVSGLTPALPEIVAPEIVVPDVTPVTEVDPVAPVDTDGIAVPSASAEVILAQCLTANGVKLYTASWCGHCKNQKAAFGDGLQYLTNVECAVNDGWAQECKDAGVESVPTWVFADGYKKSGNTPLATLAELGDCVYE